MAYMRASPGTVVMLSKETLTVMVGATWAFTRITRFVGAEAAMVYLHNGGGACRAIFPFRETLEACRAVTFAYGARATAMFIAMTRLVKVTGSLSGESAVIFHYRQITRPI